MLWNDKEEIMKITWETEISELLTVEEAVGIVEEDEAQIRKRIEPRIDALELEMTVGGLAKQALVFDGNTPLYDKAHTIVKEYENILQQLKTIANEVETATKNKRREELLELQRAVKVEQDKMVGFKNQNLNLAKQADASPSGTITMGYGPYSYSVTGDFYRDSANSNQKRIDQLQEKLDRISVELKKV